jgi:hypothetical protein
MKGKRVQVKATGETGLVTKVIGTRESARLNPLVRSLTCDDSVFVCGVGSSSASPRAFVL